MTKKFAASPARDSDRTLWSGPIALQRQLPFPSTNVQEKSGAVYTKPWVVELILDLASYTVDTNLVDAVAVDPAAGSGAFLVPSGASASGLMPKARQEPYFPVDPAFKNASYSKRYEVLCRRLVLERLYDAACLTLATNDAETLISHPAEDLSFNPFIAELRGNAQRFLGRSS